MRNFDTYLKKESTIAVIGLGYVGLPIALAFAKKYKVLGFDIDQKKVESLKRGIDPNNEVDPADFRNLDMDFTWESKDIHNADCYIITVPTPIDEHKNPDLSPLDAASKTVGKYLSQGNIVIYESTVYPGCTEDFCVPILERESGLKMNTGFKVAYSPERINPGDKEHIFTKITKVVSASDEESLEVVASLYDNIIIAGIHKAASIKIAEAAKIIENTQRDLNIALMNELSLIFNKMEINTFDVLEAAGTKWNFLNFTPGLVGGHCIGVDPYYLTHKAKQIGFYPRVILAGRETNDEMGIHIAHRIIKSFASQGKILKQSKVLVMGATFKENVTDIRNSKVIDIVRELKTYSLTVHLVDPYASSEEYMKEYGQEIQPHTDKDYDAVLVAVNHKEYQILNEDYFLGIAKKNALLYDLKGIYKNKIKTLKYMSL